MVVTAVLAGICGYLGFGATLELMPVTEQMPLYFLGENVDDYHTTVKPLQESALHINDSVLRYHIKTYVEGRESYRYQRLEAQKSLVRSMSTQDEYSRYMQFINQANPQSPVNRLGAFGNRKAELVSLTLHYAPGTTELQKNTDSVVPTGATAMLKVVTESRNQSTEENFSVEMTFNYTPVIVNQETAETTPMHFEVSSYQLR
jgi:type IV secretory pathway component VirB8